jgi:ubiquinone biosynthesis protein
LLAGYGLAFDPQLAGAFRALVTLEGTLRTLDPTFELVGEMKRLATGVGRRALGPSAMRHAIVGDVLRLAPMLRSLPRRLDRITAAMERDEWGLNVRMLANERDVRLITRLVDRGIVAFMSASIGTVSALLLGVTGGVNVTKGLTMPQMFGYIGLGVATILGLRVLVAVTRDRVM